MSLTLDPAKMWSRDLVQEDLDSLVSEFEEIGIALSHRHHGTLAHLPHR